MPKADSWETGVLNLLFNNTTFAPVSDTGLAGSTTAGSLYVSLHTATPGDTGNQASNEVATSAYTGYARVAVARTSAGWTVAEVSSVASATNTAAVTFPLCTGGTGATITYVGVGTAASGNGTLLYYGALTSNLNVSNNITPSFAAGALVLTED